MTVYELDENLTQNYYTDIESIEVLQSKQLTRTKSLHSC